MALQVDGGWEGAKAGDVYGRGQGPVYGLGVRNCCQDGAQACEF